MLSNGTVSIRSSRSFLICAAQQEPRRIVLAPLQCSGAMQERWPKDSAPTWLALIRPRETLDLDCTRQRLLNRNTKAHQQAYILSVLAHLWGLSPDHCRGSDVGASTDKELRAALQQCYHGAPSAEQLAGVSKQYRAQAKCQQSSVQTTKETEGAMPFADWPVNRKPEAILAEASAPGFSHMKSSTASACREWGSGLTKIRPHASCVWVPTLCDTR